MSCTAIAGRPDRGALSLSVYVSSDYRSGDIEFAGGVAIKRVNYPF